MTNEEKCELLTKALTELSALVWGECPSLLDESRGGSSQLAIEIETALGITSATWNRITSDPGSLPEEGRPVILGWDRDTMGDGKPYVEKLPYTLKRSDGQSCLEVQDSLRPYIIWEGKGFPTHWQYWPDPPEVSE